MDVLPLFACVKFRFPQMLTRPDTAGRRCAEAFETFFRGAVPVVCWI